MRLSPLLYLLALCITSFPSTAAEYIFTNVHVISMSSDESANAADSAQTLRDQAVIIAGDRIQAIVPMTDFDAATDIMTESTPSKPVIIDGQGRYLLPGLAEMHGHVPPLEDAGMSPYEVLYSGTVAVGDYFAEYDNFGQVREGYRADLILVDENPLTQLATLGRPAGVMVRGQWLDRDTLDEKLTEIETAYQ